MTITQRIELRRLGYTKEEIAELAELEKAPQTEEVQEAEAEAQQPEVVQEIPQTRNDISSQLLSAINNLTAVLQNQKLNQTAQPEIKQETAEDIFNNILKG